MGDTVEERLNQLAKQKEWKVVTPENVQSFTDAVEANRLSREALDNCRCLIPGPANSCDWCKSRK